MSEEAVPWVTVGIAGDFEVDWEGNRMALASDSASAGNFGCWTLVEVLVCYAAGADRNWMMCSRVPCHVQYIATEGEDNCCIEIVGEHMNRCVVVRHSCYSSSLLHLGHLALL